MPGQVPLKIKQQRYDLYGHLEGADPHSEESDRSRWRVIGCPSDTPRERYPIDTFGYKVTVPSKKFLSDVDAITGALSDLPTQWDGKACVLELKEADYNWKQMEWWAFYFEFKCFALKASGFDMPGRRYGNVGFDATRKVNWDLKSKAIKSDDHRAILNDMQAMEHSIEENGEHGVVIALCDVEYNDEDRSFQRWHSELKGGLSNYEKGRRKRTSISRYRKTKAVLTELLVLRFHETDLSELGVMRQGRNSNGNPRNPKYMLDLEEAARYIVKEVSFDK